MILRDFGLDHLPHLCFLYGKLARESTPEAVERAGGPFPRHGLRSQLRV